MSERLGPLRFSSGAGGDPKIFVASVRFDKALPMFVEAFVEGFSIP